MKINNIYFKMLIVSTSQFKRLSGPPFTIQLIPDLSPPFEIHTSRIASYCEMGCEWHFMLTFMQNGAKCTSIKQGFIIRDSVYTAEETAQIC